MSAISAANNSNVLPDLSAITSVVGLRDATTDPVIAGLSTGAFVDPNSSSPAVALLSQTSSSDASPATIVDLSDHAKALLAQAAVDQVAADRLQQQVEATRRDGANAQLNKPNSSKSIFDQMHDLGSELAISDSPGAQPAQSASDNFLSGTPLWQQQGSADNIAILQAGAQLYNKAQAMQDIAKNGGQFASPTEGHVVSDDVLFVYQAHLQIAQNISDLQTRGMISQAQALSDALQNGTLKFQKASDVPDLNMQSWMIHFPDAGAGGEMGSSSVNPTGAVKTAFDGGQALALSMGDRGDFYVTW